MLSRVPRRSARQEMRLAASYALIGERDLARMQVERAKSRAPGQDFVELARIGYPFEQDCDRQRMMDAIRLALAMADET